MNAASAVASAWPSKSAKGFQKLFIQQLELSVVTEHSSYLLLNLYAKPNGENQNGFVTTN